MVTKKHPRFFINFILMILLVFCSLYSYAEDADSFLTKPTGQYGVGYQDFDWINTNPCSPDDIFSVRDNPLSTGMRDYSPGNTKHCHETVVRIYYPTTHPAQLWDFYYPPFINHIQENLRTARDINPDFAKYITEEQIQQLSTIQSYSTYKAPAVAGKIFPVILFSPGTDEPAEQYENSITELASHGYVVIGINTPFLNFTEINGVPVYTIYETSTNTAPYLYPVTEEKDALLATRQQQDLEYVFNYIHDPKNTLPKKLSDIMDLNHIGAYGHSIGGDTVAAVTHKHENDSQQYFQAAAALDIDGGKKFNIPFMHQASAYQLALHYELGKNGYLVVMSPSEQNVDYSAHMNFSDMSTLQYFQTLKLVYDYTKQIGGQTGLGNGDGLKIAYSINTYLLTFFNTFLKGDIDPTLKMCGVLTSNTYLKCGSDTFGG